jgi:hypothetical protein
MFSRSFLYFSCSWLLFGKQPWVSGKLINLYIFEETGKTPVLIFAKIIFAKFFNS